MEKDINFRLRVVQTSITLFCLVRESFATVFCFKVTSACMGKSRLQTERYCREPLGTATLSAPRGKVADSVRTCIGDFWKKSPMNPKTFIEEDKIPSAGSANKAHPTEGILMKVLLQIFASQ